MSTLQVTPQNRRNLTPRRRTVLALAGLIAVGLALLILIPTGHRPSPPSTGSTAREAAVTVQAPAPSGYFRDPATHRLLRVSPTHHHAPQRPAGQSRGRIIP